MDGGTRKPLTRANTDFRIHFVYEGGWDEGSSWGKPQTELICFKWNHCSSFCRSVQPTTIHPSIHTVTCKNQSESLRSPKTVHLHSVISGNNIQSLLLVLLLPDGTFRVCLIVFPRVLAGYLCVKTGN